ncbi:MAG TPA: penicillin-binding protein [Treponemataceae bacterium]|nr:penicillin-binding protein [Treponemataceae bacterium]
MEVGNNFSRPRLIFLASIASIVCLFVLWNFATAMLIPKDAAEVKMGQTERGSILDRNGKILAVQTTLYNIAINRSSIPDKIQFAEILSPATGISIDELKSKLLEDGSDFFYLKKKISEGEKTAIEAAIRDGNLKGIRLEAVLSRTYPENQLASHIVGFFGDDGWGLTGVEYSFQDVLSPPGLIHSDTSSGYNVMLTIDGNIQYELEKIGRQTMKDTSAEALIMIAVESKTGEILAYVSEPSANLNTYTQASDSQRKDRPALYAYEPGSVFKIFSISALMDLGLVNENDIFLCDGEYTQTTARGEKITIGCLDKHGWLVPRDIIKYSCNDGTAQIAERALGSDFEMKLRDFGFGGRTGIELPGETPGLFASSKNWSLRTKPTIAIGQEISVSALQMVQAATTLANEGISLKLSLLSRLYTRDGEPVYIHERTPIKQVISAKNARLMLDYMQTTAESGTGTRAAVGDVPMAVKTGTAQMLNDTKDGYSKTNFISSCMGIFPSDNPEIILYLAIIKPVGETYGGRIAAPVISKAANAIIDYRGMGRTSATSVRHTGIVQVQKNQPVILGSHMPDLTGISKRMLTPLLQRTDITVQIVGDGYVTNQFPEPGTAIEQGMQIELNLE